MVYYGVPSRGCYLCRSRKIKCDETKPFCNRCRKSRRECPGYPVIPDTNTKRRGGDGDSRRVPDGTTFPEFVIPALDSTLKIPLQDAASCHFLSNFVLMAPKGTNRGFMEFLPPLYVAAAPGDPFSLAFTACSLASLSYREGFDPLLEQQAAACYVKALSATSSALYRPSIATSDATLGAVLLLALYELQSANTQSVSGWGSHIVGSIHLINSRSWKQLERDVGMSLFVAVRAQLILFAMVSGNSVPTTKDWWGKGTFKDKFAIIALHLATKTTELRHELRWLLDLESATLENFAQVSKVLEQCRVVDVGFQRWAENLPEYFRFQAAAWISPTMNHKGDPDVLPGRVDAFSDPWVACIWNMIRCSRLELCSLIIRCLAIIRQNPDLKSHPEHEALYQTSAELIGDIISSIPYQIGWFKERAEMLSKIPSFVCGHNGAASSLGGFVAIVPLMCIKDHEHATPEQQIWCETQLQNISARFGFRGAATIGRNNLSKPSALAEDDYNSRSARLWRKQKAAAAAEAQLLADDGFRGLPLESKSGLLSEPSDVAAISLELALHPKAEEESLAQPHAEALYQGSITQKL